MSKFAEIGARIDAAVNKINTAAEARDTSATAAIQHEADRIAGERDLIDLREENRAAFDMIVKSISETAPLPRLVIDAAAAEAQREADQAAAEAEAKRIADQAAADAEAKRLADQAAADAEAKREADQAAADAEAQRLANETAPVIDTAPAAAVVNTPAPEPEAATAEAEGPEPAVVSEYVRPVDRG